MITLFSHMDFSATHSLETPLLKQNCKEDASLVLQFNTTEGILQQNGGKVVNVSAAVKNKAA